tara:strand:+ start:962 stop:1144 length:183 start_codon:yes stop_codon:yes gene_type:complete
MERSKMPAYKWSDDDEYGKGGRRPMKNKKTKKKGKKGKRFPKKQSDYRKQAGRKKVRRGR